ncbi:MAG: glycosyl transferase family 1 [Gemmatales bacterium]|nr:MAG: glycosyl transferase family 1 [Gemmatales bacterium]
MDAHRSLRIALVHDWLTGMRGGEKCLEVACRRWPEAPLYTLLYRPGSLTAEIENRPVHCSFLQRLPAVHRYYRYLLPFMPLAVRSWRIEDCDLVLSMSHCVAKSAVPPAHVPHVCYCFTPMRYAWHMRDAYFSRSGLKGKFIGWILDRLRQWDRATASRVTHFVAISHAVKRRIAECYQRSSVVIYPPVDTAYYTPSRVPRENYYLAVSAFAPYKRLDLAIAACNRLQRQLVVIGTGQDERRLRTMAGPTVHFLGWQPDHVLRHHFRRCKALLFPGEEDFGIVPLEAHACGAPVIAFAAGGATETVVPPKQSSQPTGVWFDEQTPDCLAQAILDFENQQALFDPIAARQQAERFNSERFARELFAYVDQVVQSKHRSTAKAA